VALKREFLDSEHMNPQHIWRVDGKSLLQKFTLCNENMYKSVSTVSITVKIKINHIYN